MTLYDGMVYASLVVQRHSQIYQTNRSLCDKSTSLQPGSPIFCEVPLRRLCEYPHNGPPSTARRGAAKSGGCGQKRKKKSVAHKRLHTN